LDTNLDTSLLLELHQDKWNADTQKYGVMEKVLSNVRLQAKPIQALMNCLNWQLSHQNLLLIA